MEKIILLSELRTDSDFSDELEHIINTSEPGTVIKFEKGNYHIIRYINVHDVRNITIDGCGAVFTTHFDAVKPENTCGMFICRNCVGLTFRNMNFDTDSIVASAGVVTKTDADNLFYEMKLENGFSMDNGEIMRAVDSFDENGVPDYVMVHYLADTEYENLGENLLRVRLTADHKHQIENLKIGHKMSVRHSIDNKPIWYFAECTDTKMEDIRIYSANNVAVIKGCKNLTVRRFCVKAHEGSKKLMSTVKDGFWIHGLRGKLILEDSHFERVGDDSLNIHSTGKKTLAADGNVITFADNENDDTLWAKRGDVLDIHDADTFEKKCSLTVLKYSCGKVIFDGNAENIKPRDVICNTAYYCSAAVKNTVVKNSRARAFLFQTHNVTVENCDLSDTGLAAVLIAPDMRIWYELGPSADITVKNNRITNCCHDRGILSNGAVSVMRAHDAVDTKAENQIHSNITIENNVITDCPITVLHAEGTDGLIFKNNIIENCVTFAETEKDRKENPLNVYGCKNVEISGNTLNGKEI